jgi:hypothetical protein
MADWYVSSAVYSVGNIVKPTAPALKAQWAFRCTVAGTASTEPAWPTANNATITTGGATFANVSGQSTYGWGAAAGDIPSLIGAVGTFRFAGGDRIFVSSDHSETQTATTIYGTGTATPNFSGCQVLSVNRAGSVPPAAADLLAGATCTGSGTSITIEAGCPIYHYGINYICSGTVGIAFNQSAFKTHYFDACQLYLSGAGASGARIFANNACGVILNNSTVRFAAVGQLIDCNGGPMDLTWLNTTGAIVGSIPSVALFTTNATGQVLSVVARGVDLSALTSALFSNNAFNSGCKFLFDSCRIAPGVARYSMVSVANSRDLVELVNCYDGTSILNESYQPAGAVTTERTITLSGGATDDVGTFSHKLVSGTNIDAYVNTLNGFWMDAEQQAVGSAHTATVEIISSGTLNNNDISLLLEYQGTAGSSVASFANTLPTNVLTAAAAVTTSTATWNSSPATPVAQKLQVTFTPQVAGRVRGLVRLGKASTTVYVNPVVTIA